MRIGVFAVAEQYRYSYGVSTRLMAMHCKYNTEQLTFHRATVAMITCTVETFIHVDTINFRLDQNFGFHVGRPAT